MKFKKLAAAVLSAAIMFAAAPVAAISNTSIPAFTVSAASADDMPQEYKTACDWVWQNRILREESVKDWSTVFDQIIAGNGTLNYILIWQSYETITLEQRQKLPKMLEDAVNAWTDNLVGYDDWPFEHINVNVIGYAVLDKSCLLDLQPDEVVYTDTAESWLHDGMISSGMGDSRVPAIQPAEPTDISRYVHWADSNWSYNGSYDNRYDMYLHGITGMIDMGGYGYHYGQILSDNSVFGLINGTSSQHILLHEMGHSFGFPDYYGAEGESDGFPPGGFPGGEGSIMMAGSCTYINSFDQWFIRYTWNKIKDEAGRFDMSAITTQPTTEPVVVNTESAEFTDTVTNVSDGSISFENNGTYQFSGTDYFGGDDSKNLSYYEAGDNISVKFTYNTDTRQIISIEYININQNSHKIKGDVNADGEFNAADIVTMQNWLLAKPGSELADWQAGDLCEDGRIDVFDMVMMRKILISL